jgi:hypothetical protein
MYNHGGALCAALPAAQVRQPPSPGLDRTKAGRELWRFC